MEARPLLSPVWLALTIVSYVGLVLGTPPLLRLLGLRPLKAQALKCVYNFVVSVGSAALCVALLREYFGSELRFICNSGPAPEYLATLLYLFHVSKFAEVCDTLLLLLSHKEAGFFHVYHHATIVMVTWDVTRDGGSDGYFIAAFNTFVHGWMYGYYALASVRWPCPWKPLLTQLQMAQQFSFLVYGLAYFVVFGGSCELAFRLQIVHVVYPISLLYLFYKFYLSAYSKPKSGSRGPPDGAKAE